MIKRNSVVAYRDADRMASVTFASTNVKTGPAGAVVTLSPLFRQAMTERYVAPVFSEEYPERSNAPVM